MFSWKHPTALLTGLALFSAAAAAPIDTRISYQGSLLESGVPANGTYDLTLQLWDGPDSGSGMALGGAIVFDDVPVTDGVFTVYPDFGAMAFEGGARWLEIGVRDGASTGGYTLLSPFQPLTPAPQSRYAVNADMLDGMHAGDFAVSGHAHATLTPGTGLTGSAYDGTAARTFAVAFGAGNGDVAPGTAPLTINASNGLSGGVSNDNIGDGVVATLSVQPGDAISSTPSGVSVRYDDDTIVLGTSNRLRLGDSVAGPGLVDTDPEDGVIPGVNTGDGLMLDGDQVAARVDGATIGINGSGELEVISGAGGAGYGNVAVVATSGGDYADPVAARDDLATWCGTPSQSNPCLIRIMPGEYDLTGETFNLVSYLDVRGSGPAVTQLLTNSTSGFNPALFRASGECANRTCEIRDLSIRADNGTSTEIRAFYFYNNSGPRIRNVNIRMNSTSQSATPVRLSTGETVMEQVRIRADGGFARAIHCDGCTLTLIDAVVESDGTGGSGHALYINDGGTVTARDSLFHAYGATSQARTIELFDGDFSGRNVTVTAGPGTTHAYGIYAQGDLHAIELTDSRVLATSPSAAANTAIFSFQTRIEATDTLIQGFSSPGTDIGIELLAAGLTLNGAEVIGADSGVDGSWNSGGPYFVRIRDSILDGATESIGHSSAYNTRIVFSELRGGAASGFANCVSVVDENFTFFASSCP